MTPTTPTRFVDNGDGTVTDTTTGRLHTPMKCVCTQKGAGCTNRCDRKVSAPTVAPAEASIRNGYRHVVHELLTNIKRTAIRSRKTGDARLLATCDHVENLADEALSYFDTVAPAEGRENTWIALDDAMPEPERFVLTWDGKRVGVDWWGSKRHRGDGVTHWAPFAAPPGAGPMYGIAHPLTPENAP
jgi:hypothetical protein